MVQAGSLRVNVKRGGVKADRRTPGRKGQREVRITAHGRGARGGPTMALHTKSSHRILSETSPRVTSVVPTGRQSLNGLRAALAGHQVAGRAADSSAQPIHSPVLMRGSKLSVTWPAPYEAGCDRVVLYGALKARRVEESQWRGHITDGLGEGGTNADGALADGL
ncbi:hypothetical protein PHYPSEUDO_004409 [Phytophthora pseudosyringae]|uniref:Uncharacterized protein n=1 Tax=Phytophthora pseudosyringae TaxID=221518 RepID=A0A8T1VR47_9STRA|nr:hypothetical protein PHYPSEUDO_004409 [Phytophthora pseudosyringae]